MSIEWVLGHEVIEGSEKADQEAKIARKETTNTEG